MKRLKDLILQEGRSHLGTRQEVQHAIKDIKKLQDSIFDKVTDDDEVHNGFDVAIRALEDILSEM